MNLEIASSAGSSRDLKHTLRAFCYRNYRLFFAGQTISLVGTWTQQVALVWLVYRLSNSAFWLGMVGFAGQIPTFLISPVAGVLADRWNLKRILIATQVLAMLQAFVLVSLVASGTIAVWNIILLSVLLGCIHAFDIPARHSFLVEIIEKKEDLGNAIALNSSMFHGARLLGPTLAGLLIAAAGEGICFALNGISYVAILAALFAMKIAPRNVYNQHRHVLAGLKEGFAYAFGFAPMKSLLLLAALFSLAGMPYAVLLPIFAKNILQGDSSTLGFLVGASGMGALAGAVYLASRKSVRGLGKIIALAAGIFGVGISIFSASRLLWSSLCLMFVSGFGMMVLMAACNTVLQTLVDDDKRGRVMSLYTMAFMGVVPFGSLLAGVLASSIGAPSTLLLEGLICIAASLIFAIHLPYWKKMVRPVYLKKGIMPEVESASPWTLIPNP